MVIEQELREAGLRVTDGRTRVLRMLESHPHADAATLHAALNELGHRTSVQSVHNILGDLVDAGVIRRIEPAGSAARYERRAHDNHHHIVCTSCSAIADVDCAVGEAPCLHPADMAGFTIASAEVTFWGLCEDCATDRPIHSSEPLTTAR
ncbi:Fur family transcriptional regulator [Leifsonia sp. H3M29-4]|jgi:Fe2+ or Zn2+ uptake regulation protein|uniref:Fur family transcriptional regulator n=1 Tax=Salinibacterium metalliresistens TaxID=3031321 RepID=UPI0023DBC15F|nr:Fur family transcriptional regulator [Salinibacterium metalliresistens]MDF1479189.1 Fur family transcriptional regulator [Salinibacterium metalliresistens]